MAASITRRAANSLVKRAVATQARNASTLKVGAYPGPSPHTAQSTKQSVLLALPMF